MPQITVHVDHVQGLVAIESFDLPDVLIVDVQSGRVSDQHALVVPPFMTQLVDPTAGPTPATPAVTIEGRAA